MTATLLPAAAVLSAAAGHPHADVDKYEVYAVKPIAQTLDAISNLRAQDRMRTLASDPRLVIPGHDPAVFARFPHVSDRIVRIE